MSAKSDKMDKNIRKELTDAGYGSVWTTKDRGAWIKSGSVWMPLDSTIGFVNTAVAVAPLTASKRRFALVVAGCTVTSGKVMECFEHYSVYGDKAIAPPEAAVDADKEVAAPEVEESNTEDSGIDFVKAIHEHAVANYNKGWDIIVESTTDDEIKELVKNAKTHRGAINIVGKYIKTHRVEADEVANALAEADAERLKNMRDDTLVV